jgi:hypothetical protein
MSLRRAATVPKQSKSWRDETLVKSLLNVVGGSTRAEWRFVDEIDADLALCDPQSSFTRIAMDKAGRSGRPYCVALLYGQDSADPLKQSIRAPLRVGEFVQMLDALSDLGDMAQPAAVHAALSVLSGVHDAVKKNAVQSAANNDHIEKGQSLIDVLRQLVAANDASQPSAVWRIEADGLLLDLMLPERRYALRDREITMDALVDLALSARVDNVMRLDKADADAARAAPADNAWDVLLWRAGLRMVPDADMPWFKDDIALRLKRWPDFGRLGAQKSHLALAALLTKASWRSDALLEASGQTLAELQSFVSACGLSGLLDIQHVASLKVVPPVASRRLGVSGLFRSLRSALRMGG